MRVYSSQFGLHTVTVYERLKDGVHEELIIYDGKARDWKPMDLKNVFDNWYRTYTEEHPEGKVPDQKLIKDWWRNWL